MILLIDDECRFMSTYVEELELSGFSIHFESDIDRAWDYIEEHRNELDLIILDVIMPWGALFSADETQGGLTTGVKFYHQVRASLSQLPIIVLTAGRNDEMEYFFKREDNCSLFHKEQILPFELVAEVNRILQRT